MTEDLTERLAATGPELAHLAARVRALVAAVVTGAAPRAPLVAAAAAVDEALAALGPFVPATPAPRHARGGHGTAPGDMMPFDPVVGRMNPLAPPIEIGWDGEKAVARASLGVPWEGPPGCVHGGVIAAVFDQVFNVANLMAGVAGPTARLELRYRRPTPLATPIVFEGWVARTEGRRVHTEGRLRHHDEVTVHASGEFVRLSPERVMRLLERP